MSRLHGPPPVPPQQRLAAAAELIAQGVIDGLQHQALTGQVFNLPSAIILHGASVDRLADALGRLADALGRSK